MRFRYGTAKAEHGSLIVGSIETDGTVYLFVKFEHDPSKGHGAAIIDGQRVTNRKSNCCIAYPADEPADDEHAPPSAVLYSNDVCVWSAKLTRQMIADVCEWLRS
jgi:hypothetical protein